MLPTLIQEIKDIQAAIAGRDWQGAARKLVALQQQAIDLLFGPPTTRGGPEQLAALKAAIDECAAHCVTTAAGPETAASAAKILDLIRTVLPLILQLIG